MTFERPRTLPLQPERLRRRSSLRLASVLGGLSGLLLPLYWLDESVPFRSEIVIIIGASIVAWAAMSPANWRYRDTYWNLFSFIFVYFFVISLAAVAHENTVGVNQIYPLLFLLLCFRRLRGRDLFLGFLLLSTTGVVLFGWYRFFTGAGGLPSEHGLGYWGIKYTESTRNNDVLAPLVLMGGSVMLLVSRPQLSRFLKGLLGVLAVLGAAATALSYSRGAWLAACAFLLLAFRGNPFAAMKYLRTTLIVVIIAALVPVAFVGDIGADRIDTQPLIERWNSMFVIDDTSSNLSRLKTIDYAIHVGLANPIIGVGPHGFGCCFGEYDYLELVGVEHSENLFVDLFVRHGIFVAVSALLLLMGAGIRGLYSRDGIVRLCGAGILSAVIWLQFSSEWESLLVWTVLGILCSRVRSIDAERRP